MNAKGKTQGLRDSSSATQLELTTEDSCSSTFSARYAHRFRHTYLGVLEVPAVVLYRCHQKLQAGRRAWIHTHTHICIIRFHLGILSTSLKSFLCC